MKQISFLPPLPQKPAKQVTVTPKRRRKKFSVWLEVDNPAHKPLIQELNALKSGGQMSPHLRSALELWFDLQQGGTAILEREFPHLLKSAAPPIDLTAILDKLDRLQAAPAPTRVLTPLKPLEDDLPELEIKEAVSDENPTFNMILSTLSIGMGVHTIPLEILEYGIKKGRVPASALDEWHQKRGKPVAVAGPKAMNVQTDFGEPVFDDDFLDALGAAD